MTVSFAVGNRGLRVSALGRPRTHAPRRWTAALQIDSGPSRLDGCSRLLGRSGWHGGWWWPARSG